MKILVVGLGGTIGSVKGDSIHLDRNNLKILDYCQRNDVIFEGVSPFSVLSENTGFEHWHRLIDYISGINFNSYGGVIILHGSDTLAYTSALIYNAFPKEKIVIVAADKPIEDKASNGIKNFNKAVDCIVSNDISCPVVSYNGIFKADCVCSIGASEELFSIESNLPPVDNRVINDKNILIINPYVQINFDNYNFDRVDGVLFTMYHSATVDENTAKLCAQLKEKGIEYHFVTHRSHADYETSSNIDNIIFNCTVENAYVRMLLK
ncbi:MAG: asparaginase domain-containing protein [Eubacterium sp.]